MIFSKIRAFANPLYLMLGELNELQINNILTSQVIGRLGCTDGIQPYVVPVTYVYDGKYIYGQTNEGKKLRILRKNPKVCFEVDLMLDMRNWQSVLVFGKFEEFKTEQAKEKSRDILFNRIFALMTSSTVHSHEHESTAQITDDTRIKYVMYRIKIKKITGRFEKL
jgi:nitroimidazol reductase NimA-like FMN-containing flavoprotein (pyridoxamine 5'-phosphate oxidase superfamily)